jgi:hypothetical protein
MPLEKVQQDSNSRTPVLDNMRHLSQLLSNLGCGAIGIPGLQAAGQIAIQVIDLIKVRRTGRSIDVLLMYISSENTREQRRMRTARDTHRGAHGLHP